MAKPIVKKLDPLRCPKCSSDRATLGFTQKKFVKRVGMVSLPDGWVYCDSCKHKTHAETGKSEALEPRPYGKRVGPDEDEIEEPRRIHGKRK